MSVLKTLTRKESSSYLNSSIALIFLGTFLVLTLFTFFWVDKFFERNIADLRPLFHWMPMLMIFLVSALTMRSWAEERNQGTLELLLTWPVKIPQLVFGKFLGVMKLVALALLMTLPLVATVFFMGELDWGPMLGGYLGCLLMAGAYAAIGLWVSSMAGSQIVALICTGLLGGFFYLIGSDQLVSLMDPRIAEVLRALGTGSRFESIARGVVDLRDVVYYASLGGAFLILNMFTLARERWSEDAQHGEKASHRAVRLGLIAALLNLVLLNLWLAPVPSLRLDLTARREFTISPTTKELVRSLHEPLLIKFYSTQTHPLLDPLRPQVRDLIKEYEILSRGRIKAVFVDPTKDEKEEREANQTYNIKPVPFQIPGRNEMKIVNSYFNILVKYGDQHMVLGFDDLIEISVSDMSDIEVKLRNLEYDLTRAIKKVVYGFQGMEEVFAAIAQPIQAKIVLTSKTLPPEIAPVRELIEKVYADLAKLSGGKFSFEVIDADAPGATLTREKLLKDYKIKPFSVSPFTHDTFFFHTILEQSGEAPEILYPTGDFSEVAVRAAVEGAIKHRAKGFLKTIGLVAPSPMNEGMPPQFRNPRGDESFRLLHETLQGDYKIKEVDLKSGAVDKDIDVLLVIKPKEWDEAQRFAVDQFLMQGGTVLVASGSFSMNPGSEGGLGVEPLTGGMGDLLASYGIEIEKNLVLDEQNESFPVPMMRNVGGMQVQDMQLVRYPFFVDVRGSGMAKNHPALAGLPAVTLQWSSALKLNDEKVKTGAIATLLHSSEKSWVQTTGEVQPNFETYPELGFPSGELKPSVLAATAHGPFSSFYKDKTSPLTQRRIDQEKTPIAKGKKPGKANEAKAVSEEGKAYDRIITESPEAARLVVVGSGDFLSDRVLGLSRSTGQDRYMNNLHLMQNLVDWSVEDTDLLSIRSRGTYARTLVPVPLVVKNALEAVNYVLVLVMLIVLAVMLKIRRSRVKPLFETKGAESLTQTQEKAA